MLTIHQRAVLLNDKSFEKGPVVYWMNRDMRLDDNWALIYSQTLANQHQVPCVVIVSIDEKIKLEDRILHQMKMGLKLIETQAKSRHLPFFILSGPTVKTIQRFIKEVTAGMLVTDFSPLRPMRALRNDLATTINIPFVEVDAHNVVPYHVASQKQEWGAYTLRPKIHRLLNEYLHPYPTWITTMPFQYQGIHDMNYLQDVKGHYSPTQALSEFLAKRLDRYEERNNPTIEATSRLSSYLHFGHLSSQTIALAVKKTKKPHEAFLEELIVRKELADNFCFYNPNYDSFLGFPDWAKKTLNVHRSDKRSYLYSLATLAKGLTHDDAWNAAQIQMVKTGYMHGYMRMYWAKKILEWTATPEEAILFANTLNDQFELDGSDPNGYTGTAWAIGGVHDRPWQERPIFGMIRYMNAAGLKRKFDIGSYIRQWLDVEIKVE
jgi:deoxyribodipyrimidine photo-lyase